MWANVTSTEHQRLTELATEILREVFPRHFIGDNMFVADRNMAFLRDKKFEQCLLDIAKAPIYKGMAWRLHTLIWAAQQVAHLPGDFVECGVFRGFKSFFLMTYLDFNSINRGYWLYDTFEGIAEQYSNGSPISEDEHKKPGLLEFVTERFGEFHRANIIKGAVPDSFAQGTPDQVAWLHLDMNSYEAEIGALEILFDRMPTGGIVILDDYGFYVHHAQQEKEDIWFEQQNHKVLELPTGQGLVIKK